MRWSDILLLLLNALLTAKLFSPLAPLLLFLVVGYALILYAAVMQPRLAADGSRLIVTATLAAWTFAWYLVNGASLQFAFADRFPNLGLTSATLCFTRIAGASYIFLKVYDLIRRIQKGAPPPGLVQYLNQMLFAPSFIAGPIVGPDPFRRIAPSRAALGEGLNRIIAGVLKLYVIAQLLAPLNLLGGRDTAALSAFMNRKEIWMGLYASSLWIYFDFAGYSDLAVGTGLILGVRLPENFDAPYLAPNPSEFWQRWHMSFTNWLREHVFSPVSKAFLSLGLGGGSLALAGSASATMIACALWHRLSAPFLIWGVYHATLVVAHQLFASRLKPRLASRGLGPFFAGRVYRALATVATFHAIAVGWVLFLPLDAPLAEHRVVLERLFLP